MKSTTKITSEERRAAIIKTARTVFVERGFSGSTTRALADAAGVSEALLFKHFPSKEALYAAILKSCFDEEGSKAIERLQALKPSTATLVFLVQDLVSHVLGGQPDEGERAFFRLVLRSLMDSGEFTRFAIQGPPSHWVRKVEECIAAADTAGDMVDNSIPANLGGWFSHQLIAGIIMHSLPAAPVVEYGVPREELVKHVIRFCLRGMGLKDAVIQRSVTGQGLSMA